MYIDRQINGYFMKVLGITGGIGSGKSYVSAIFHRMGVPFYNADGKTKSLYRTVPELKSKVRSAFGDNVMDGEEISFPALAAMVFPRPENLRRLEDIVYPYLMEDFRKWRDEEVLRGSQYVIFESAILMEKELFRDMCDYTVSVEAPLDLRIQRVMTRDGVSREKVVDRLKNQWNDEERRRRVDFILTADGKRALLPQIEAVHMIMLK